MATIRRMKAGDCNGGDAATRIAMEGGYWRDWITALASAKPKAVREVRR
ncbi:MAG: hypothetical protein ACR2PR_09045 [Pseudohongiellaceae bacterium]